MILLWIVGILTGLITYIWWRFERPFIRHKRMTKNIPGPPSLPVIGSTYLIGRYPNEILGLFEDCYKYGSMFKIRFPGDFSVMISDPKDIEILLTNNENLAKNHEVTNLLRPWLGDSLGFSVGKKWKEHRRLITPTFHFNILEKFFVVFNEQGDTFVDLLRPKADGKTCVDVQPMLQMYSFDVISETAMGIKIHAQTKGEGSEYIKAVYEISSIIRDKINGITRLFPFIYQFTQLARNEAKTLGIIKNYVGNVIQQRSSELRENAMTETTTEDQFGAKKRLAFLDFLLQAKLPNGEPMGVQEIEDEVEAFMVAGHDTTATQLGFVFYYLSKNPEYQEGILQELSEVLGDEDRELTFQEVQKLSLLERVIKESQRLTGSAVLYGRQLSHDLKFSNGVILPKDTNVNVLTYQVHMNPQIYPEPKKFDPDRFLPEVARTRSPYAFVPFSAGPRNCLGQKFAMLEMKTLMAKVCRTFKILPGINENGKEFEADLRIRIFITSINGIMVRLTPRK